MDHKVSDRWKVSLVKDICCASEANYEFTRQKFEARFMVPLAMGHLRLCADRQVLYTWSRPGAPLTRTPTLDDWKSKGQLLWVVDMVFKPSLTPLQATRWMLDDMRSVELAGEGEAIAFWRSSQQRYGYVRA